MRNPLLPSFKISRVSWRDLVVSFGPLLALIIATVWITLHFVRPAPPSTIVMTSGADGSMFEVYTGRYAKILAQQGVTLKILPSQGSLENLKRLSDPTFTVDVGFVQGGIATLGDANHSPKRSSKRTASRRAGNRSSSTSRARRRRMRW